MINLKLLYVSTTSKITNVLFKICAYSHTDIKNCLELKKNNPKQYNNYKMCL